jgi:hypothetical protein
MTWVSVTQYFYHKCTCICSVCRHQSPIISSFIAYRRDCNNINTIGATGGSETVYPSGVSEFIPAFKWH